MRHTSSALCRRFVVAAAIMWAWSATELNVRAGYDGWVAYSGRGDLNANYNSPTNAAFANDSAFFGVPSVAIPAADGYSGTTDLPGNADPTGFIRARGAFRARLIHQVHIGQGDSADQNDLSSLLTPVSNSVSGGLDMQSNEASASDNSITYAINWYGTDSGAAQRLRWYYYPLDIPDTFSGDNRNLPQWSSVSRLMHEELRVGPWNESSLQVTITIPLNDPVNYPDPSVSRLILVAAGAYASLPEPASVCLVAGAFAIGLSRRRIRS